MSRAVFDKAKVRSMDVVPIPSSWTGSAAASSADAVPSTAAESPRHQAARDAAKARMAARRKMVMNLDRSEKNTRGADKRTRHLFNNSIAGLCRELENVRNYSKNIKTNIYMQIH